MFNSVKSDSQYELSGCDYSDEPTQQGPLQVVLFCPKQTLEQFVYGWDDELLIFT